MRQVAQRNSSTFASLLLTPPVLQSEDLGRTISKKVSFQIPSPHPCDHYCQLLTEHTSVNNIMSAYKEGTENTTSIKSYAAVAQKTKPQELNDNPPQIIKIVPPLTKAILKSSEKLTEAYKQCASTILQKFPAGLKDQITISKNLQKLVSEQDTALPSAGKPYIDEIENKPPRAKYISQELKNLTTLSFSLRKLN